MVRAVARGHRTLDVEPAAESGVVGRAVHGELLCARDVCVVSDNDADGWPGRPGRPSRPGRASVTGRPGGAGVTLRPGGASRPSGPGVARSTLVASRPGRAGRPDLTRGTSRPILTDETCRSASAGRPNTARRSDTTGCTDRADRANLALLTRSTRCARGAVETVLAIDDVDAVQTGQAVDAVLAVGSPGTRQANRARRADSAGDALGALRTASRLVVFARLANDADATVATERVQVAVRPLDVVELVAHAEPRERVSLASLARALVCRRSRGTDHEDESGQQADKQRLPQEVRLLELLAIRSGFLLPATVGRPGASCVRRGP